MEFEFELEGIGKRINVTELVEQSESLRAVRTVLEERYRREQADPQGEHLPEARQRAQAETEQYARAGLEDLMRGFLPEKLQAIDQIMLLQLELRKLALDVNETGNYEAFERHSEVSLREQDRLIEVLRDSAPKEAGPSTRAAHDRLLDKLATRARRAPPAPTDARTKALLVEANRLLFPTDEEIAADLAEMRRRGTKTRPLRQRLKRILRERLEGFVHIEVLRANIRAIGELRARMVAARPDVIVAVERGGWFLTDVVTRNEPGLASKVERIGKLDKPALYERIKTAVEVMITSPRAPRRIAIADAYMGGLNATDLINKVFQPLLERYGQEMPDLQFGTYWIREASGFEQESGGLREPKYHGSGPYADRMAAESMTVPWIFGDDVLPIVEGVSSDPINIFDSSGDVVATIPTKPGETTYTLATRLLNGEGLDDLPEE